jgi:TonB family protein
MRTSPAAAPRAEVYSIDEVARAARVSVREAATVLRRERIVDPDALLTEHEAVHAVRFLAGVNPETARDRTPLTLAPEPARKGGLSLALSASLHAVFFLVMGAAAALGLLAPDDTEELVQKNRQVRLVYMISPGPGGGGGGGGLRMPTPPPPAERKAVKPPPKPAASVPRVRRTPPPPRPRPQPPPRRPPVIEPPRIDPVKVEPPRPDPPQFVAAPIMSIATGAMERVGDLKAPPAPRESQGPGTGGGVGSGSGTGAGPGTGSGVGPGSGGGTGGGPFRPGTGITPPILQREVRATYTDEARRRGIEGDVVLEIVVRRDGSVGQVRVLRSLGAGLEQRALDAVRQWRFSPSRRNGEPVDVAVEVAVEFKLR